MNEDGTGGSRRTGLVLLGYRQEKGTLVGRGFIEFFPPPRTDIVNDT